MSQDDNDGATTSSPTPSTSRETPKTAKRPGKQDEEHPGKRKAASRLKEKGLSWSKVEDKLLKDAALALKSATSQEKVQEEVDQDLIYGKWLGGKLKQITDPKTK